MAWVHWIELNWNKNGLRVSSSNILDKSTNIFYHLSDTFVYSHWTMQQCHNAAPCTKQWNNLKKVACAPLMWQMALSPAPRVRSFSVALLLWLRHSVLPIHKDGPFSMVIISAAVKEAGQFWPSIMPLWNLDRQQGVTGVHQALITRAVWKGARVCAVVIRQRSHGIKFPPVHPPAQSIKLLIMIFYLLFIASFNHPTHPFSTSLSLLR